MFNVQAIAATAAFIALMTSAISSASAAPRDRGFNDQGPGIGIINYRISNQAHRIQRARRGGTMNWVEVRRARFELSHIRGFRQQYMKDGWLSFREMRHLNGLLNRNSRRIRRFATNNGHQWRPWQRAGRDDRQLSKLNGFR